MSIVLRPEDFFQCPNCGSKIPIAGDFCPFCRADKREAAEAHQEEKPVETEEKKASKFGCASVIVCFACLGAAAACLVVGLKLGLISLPT